jgi:integrase
LKTQDKREFPIGQQLRLLLEEIKPDNYSLESLVFPSPKGGWIDVHNFRNRAWKTVIDSLGIEYRKPYQIRHTFISQQRALGVEDGQVAKVCGTSISMIHKHYGASN